MEWIDVNDSKPKLIGLGYSITVYVKKHGVNRMKAYYNYNTEQWVGTRKKQVLFGVTHWQHIPNQNS